MFFISLPLAKKKPEIVTEIKDEIKYNNSETLKYDSREANNSREDSFTDSLIKV